MLSTRRMIAVVAVTTSLAGLGSSAALAAPVAAKTKAKTTKTTKHKATKTTVAAKTGRRLPVVAHVA